jgi:hypothetical protein
VLTTANVAGTNVLTWLPKHGELEIIYFGYPSDNRPSPGTSVSSITFHRDILVVIDISEFATNAYGNLSSLFYRLHRDDLSERAHFFRSKLVLSA